MDKKTKLSVIAGCLFTLGAIFYLIRTDFDADFHVDPTCPTPHDNRALIFIACAGPGYFIRNTAIHYASVCVGFAVTGLVLSFVTRGRVPRLLKLSMIFTSMILGCAAVHYYFFAEGPNELHGFLHSLMKFKA